MLAIACLRCTEKIRGKKKGKSKSDRKKEQFEKKGEVFLKPFLDRLSALAFESYLILIELTKPLYFQFLQNHSKKIL